MIKEHEKLLLEKLEKCGVAIASLQTKTDYIVDKIDMIDRNVLEREQTNNRNINFRINALWTVVGAVVSGMGALFVKILNFKNI
jgi:hypothetical protein